MSKFNQTLEEPTKITNRSVTNRAGGEAYSESSEMALVNLLLTSFMKEGGKYYESASQEQERLKSLLAQVDPLFAAKAALFARLEFGMRSISHFVAAWLAGQETVRGRAKGSPGDLPVSWQRKFFNKIVFRADDILEIASAYRMLYPDSKRPLSHALGRGLRDAQQRLSEYALAKYSGKGKAWNQCDIVRLEHGTSAPINKLMKGTLPAADTWEHALSAAGQSGSETTPKQEWERLITEGKLGYFAALRNIRNILVCDLSEDVFSTFLEQLTDAKAIKQSKVLPFRFLTAIKALQTCSFSGAGRALWAISTAAEIALDNVPNLPGRTLVALDGSGSMMTCALNQGPENKRGDNIAPVMAGEAGGLFAAAMVKKQNADMILFSDWAQYFTMNPANSIVGMIRSIPFTPAGTNFNAVFEVANKAYDRIIFLTDGQGWLGGGTPELPFNNYCRQFGCRPKIYNWNLCSYGDSQFKEGGVYSLSGFSDKVFDTIRIMETDRNAMIDRITSVAI